MILSDRDIKIAIKNGDISIDPFNKKYIQPASIDLHLDNQFLVFDTKSNVVIDPKKPMDDMMDEVIITPKKPFIPVSYTHLDVYKRQALVDARDDGRCGPYCVVRSSRRRGPGG